MPAAKVCPRPGCPELTTGGPCAVHRREAEQARGSRHERGYDAKHEALRRVVKARLEAGQLVRCARCGARISAGEPFDLGHDDNDRSRYSGPEHQSCNRSAGGRAAHA
jgi:hypothetical protein